MPIKRATQVNKMFDEIIRASFGVWYGGSETLEKFN